MVFHFLFEPQTIQTPNQWHKVGLVQPFEDFINGAIRTGSFIGLRLEIVFCISSKENGSMLKGSSALIILLRWLSSGGGFGIGPHCF